MAFLETPRLLLGPLGPDDATEEYLSWLNDPEILRYRGPKALPSSMDDLKRWIAGIPARGDLVLAMRLRENGRHIGNVVLNSILWVHRSAELGIMIGARDALGLKLSREAVDAIVRHAFMNMGLHRIWTESPNPAYNRTARALGWTHEGTKRQAFLIDGKFHDLECWSILSTEYQGTPASTT